MGLTPARVVDGLQDVVGAVLSNTSRAPSTKGR